MMRGWTPFARGLGEDAAQFGCPLLGGDTVSTPGPADDLDHGRSGAFRQAKWSIAAAPKPGDRVVVTGTIEGVGK